MKIRSGRQQPTCRTLTPIPFSYPETTTTRMRTGKCAQPGRPRSMLLGWKRVALLTKLKSQMMKGSSPVTFVVAHCWTITGLWRSFANMCQSRRLSTSDLGQMHRWMKHCYSGWSDARNDYLLGRTVTPSKKGVNPFFIAPLTVRVDCNLQ